MRDEVKIEGFKRALHESEFDVVVAISVEMVCYLSGVFNDIQRTLPERISLVVWADGVDPVFLTHTNEEVQVRKESWIQNIRIYNEIEVSPIQLLAQVVNELGAARGKVGIEKRALSSEYHEETVRLLPNVQIKDAAPFFDRVRAIKTADEIRSLETAAQVTDSAIRKVFELARPGMTERQIGIMLYTELVMGGAEKLAHQILGAGANSLLTHARPGDYVVKSGDLLRTDVGGIFAGGYMSDLSRTICIGKPSQRQLDTYQFIWEELQRLIGMMQPGVPCRELFLSHKKRWEGKGWPMVRPHIGHNIGISDHEFPMFMPRDDTPLQSGMCMAIEPNHIVPGVEKYHIEDEVLITETGSRILSRSADWSELLTPGG